MRLGTWLIVVPAAIVAATLSVANRHAVRVSFDPLPFVVDAPLYAVILVAMFVGLLLGGGAAWWAGRAHRRLARQRKRETVDLARENARLKTQLPATIPAQPVP